MSKRKAPRRTFHPLDMAASLQEQNYKIAILLGAVQSFLSINPDAPGATILQQAADDCRAALYPDPENAT